MVRATIALATLLACAAAPCSALRASALARPRTSRTSSSRVRMEDAAEPAAEPEAELPSEEVDRLYSAEVDAVLARLPPYVPEEERYSFGFVPWAEKVNGRFAMMGLMILIALEAYLGKVRRRGIGPLSRSARRAAWALTAGPASTLARPGKPRATCARADSRANLWPPKPALPPFPRAPRAPQGILELF